MKPRGREGDILIDAPLARHADVVPAVEDRSYVIFIAGAIVSAVLGGFALGVMGALAQSGVLLAERGPWLLQAHGWAQLQGWAGLFVAGMGLRLLPRFAGRSPAPSKLNATLFALLFGGVVLRTVAQTLGGDGVSPELLLAGELLWAAGAAAFAVTIARTLRHGRGGNAPWRVFAFAGAGWWLVWAVSSVAAGIDARENGFVPSELDDGMAWMAMLGAIGSFIWAVQSRSVPIFFGRKAPSFSRIAAPAALLHGGIALLWLTSWLESGERAFRLGGGGFLLAGAALVWLAPVAGACWGKPTRLRPRARGAAEFVRFGNIAAAGCGLLLIWAGGRMLLDGELAAPGVRDAARHAFGLGVITMLIVGMAQLVAPFFALQRVESAGRRLLDNAIYGMLALATLLRVASGLMLGHTSTAARMHLAAAAGVLAWLGVVLFATMIVRAVRSEPRTKAALAAAVSRLRG